MAAALATEIGANIDYPAIRISKIFLHVNPHLHTATHGFEKFILASGNPIKQPTEGFFIVFASTTGRAKFKKNSKWLMSLRKDHKAHKVNTLEVCSVMYNQNRDGFLEPIFKLLFFGEEVESFYKFGEDERLVFEYLKSGRPMDIEVATNVCCDVFGGTTSCTWNDNCCTNHLSILVFGNNVAQEFEKRSLLPQAVMLRELCLAKVHKCRARKSVLPRVLHMTQLECLHNILRNTDEVEKCSRRISEELEKLEKRTNSSSNDNKDLTLHSFAFGLHCIKTDLVERGLKHLSTTIAVGSRVEIDREEAMVLQAAKTLISSLMEVAQGGVAPQDLTESTPSPAKPTAESDDSPDPEQVQVENLQESFENLSINPMPFKLCSSLRKVSDSDIEVEILGAGSKQVNIFEVELFGVDDQPIRWQNTNFQEYFGKLEQSISRGKNFVSVALNSKDEITRLWVKEYNLDDEIVCEEKLSPTKSVTFSNTRDVFGDAGDLDDEISDEIDSLEILSHPAEVEDFVTVGDSVLDLFLDKLRDRLVEEKNTANSAVKKNKNTRVPSNMNIERGADEMVASLRGQGGWFESYLEEHFNCWDAKKSRHRLPGDVDVDAIKTHLQENYRPPYSSKFNSNSLLKVTASLMAEELRLQIIKQSHKKDLKVLNNSRKSHRGQDDIINVNDSEDEDMKEKVETATQVVYKKNPEFLYVGNLPKNTTKEELEKAFAKYGKVKHVNMKGPTYCFVGFNNPDPVRKALEDCPITMRGEHKLNVGENVEKVFVKTEKADGTKKEQPEQPESEVSADQRVATVLDTQEFKKATAHSSTEYNSFADVKNQPEERQPRLSPEKSREKETPMPNEGRSAPGNEPSKEILQKMLNDMTAERDRYISLCLQLKEGKSQAEAKLLEKNKKLENELGSAFDKIKAVEERNKSLEAEVQELRSKVTTVVDDPEPSTDGIGKTRQSGSLRFVTLQTNHNVRSVPLDSDGLLPLNDVQKQVGGAVDCIFYYIRHFPTTLTRLLLLEEGKFHPPHEGWGGRVYHAKIQQNTRQSSVMKISHTPPPRPLFPITMPTMLARNTPSLLPTPPIQLPNPHATVEQILLACPLIPHAERSETWAQYRSRISLPLQTVVPLLSAAQQQLLEDYLKRTFRFFT